MAVRSFLDYFTENMIGQMKRPEMAAEGDRDSAYGANMAHGSNLLNPNPSRDAFNSLFGGTSDWVQKVAPTAALGAGSAAIPMIGRAVGGGLGQDIGGAAANTGMAAMQGFTNPATDLAALTSFAKLFGRMF